MRVQDEEREKILSRVMAVPEAISTKKKSRILQVYDSFDPKFSAFEDVPDYSLVDGSRFRRFIEELSEIKSASIDRQNVRLDFLARDVAVVTGVDDWRIETGGGVSKGRSRFTIVFWRRGSWKVIHEHFTRIPPQKDG